MIHLLVDGGELDRDTVEVEGADYRHLFRARRLKVGDRVRLVDGRGGARWSIVAGVKAGRARLDIEGPAPTFEPVRRLTLFVSVVRPQRAVWLVEKAIELGVRELQWFVSERTTRSFSERAVARQQRVAKSALEQSGGARILVVGPEGGFSEGEIEWFLGRGATLADLGPRVLRTETAAVAALAVALCAS